MSMIRRFSLSMAAIAAVWLLAPPAGVAQVPLPPVLEPSAEPSPSPTATASPRATRSSSPAPKRSEPKQRSQPQQAEQGTTPRTDPVVSEGLRLWREREKSPARTTTRLLELIQTAHQGAGDPTFEEMSQAFGRFPIVGYTWYQDDYGAPRYSPYYSAHAGTDLFAERGTPVIAVTDGTIWRMGSFSKGGNAVWLLGDDNVRYYYGHLHSIAKNLATGKRVERGDLIGTVGNTGNAVGTYPHVHFEINPGGLGTVDPKPILDAWLDNAEAAIVARIGTARAPTTTNDAGYTRWNRVLGLFSEPIGGPSLRWVAALGGSGGTLAAIDGSVWELLARADLDRATPALGAGGEDVHLIDPLAALLAAANGDDEGVGF